MSYIVEYTTLSGKKVAMVHKTYERIEEAITQAAVSVKNGNYKSYKITEGHKVLPAIDRDRYPEIPGLEGPFRTLSGAVVYYDPKEGAYYDKDRDMYLSYDEFRELDNDYSNMKDERDIPVKEEDDDRDELTKKLFPKMSPEEMKKRDQERNRKMNQQRFMKPGKPSRSGEWGAYESVTEDISQDAHHMERDHEVQMARSDLYKTANYAIKLHSILKGISEEQGLDGWMQAKITKAADYLSSVYHALEYDQLERSQSEPMPPVESVDETTTAGGIATAPMPMGKMIKRKKK